MGEFNLLNVWVGLMAYGLAIVLGAVGLLYLTFKVDILLTKADEESDLIAGKRAVALKLGATLVCQAILIRHAVPAVMEAIRTLFVYELPKNEALALIGRCFLFAAVIVGLSCLSVWIAGGVFTWLTRKIEEEESIHKDNVAIALFYAMALFAITLVLNEGMEDLVQSFIPLVRTGILEVR